MPARPTPDLGFDLQASQVQSILARAARTDVSGMLVVVTTVPIQDARLEDIDIDLLAQSTWSDRALARCSRVTIGGLPFRIPGLAAPHVLLLGGFPLRPSH